MDCIASQKRLRKPARPHRYADFALGLRKCGKGTKPPRTPRRPGAGGDPYAVSPMFWMTLVTLLNHVTAIITARGYGSPTEPVIGPAKPDPLAGTTGVKSHTKVRKCQAPTKPRPQPIWPA